MISKGNLSLYILSVTHLLTSIYGALPPDTVSSTKEDQSSVKSLPEPRNHKLTIFISPAPSNPHNIIFKNVDEPLNITCTLGYYDANDEHRSPLQDLTYEGTYTMAWHLPMPRQNSEIRPEVLARRSGITLFDTKLKETDSGLYLCDARIFRENNSDWVITSSIKISVTPKHKCGLNAFGCPLGECIPERFICDRHEDCKGGADESPAFCADDPCKGRQQCYDGRCVTGPFCYEMVFNKDHKKFPAQFQELSERVMSDRRTFIITDTTLRCVVAGLAIITIIVIALQLKKADPQDEMRDMPLTELHEDSWGNLIPRSEAPATVPGTLVTYNINHGVQLVGIPEHPPPYSEIARATVGAGPPPPYVKKESSSTEIVSENSVGISAPPVTPPLSSETTCQNNGQITSQLPIYTIEGESDFTTPSPQQTEGVDQNSNPEIIKQIGIELGNGQTEISSN